MKKIVLTFGLISGVIVSVLMGGSLLLADKIGLSHSMILGYTIMVASFLLVYFGIRSYRDNVLAGQISLGRAFTCGILITLIATVCYVAMWEVLYFNYMPHFMDSYFAAQIHQVQAAGLDSATTATRVAAIQHSQELYQNPLVNMAYTFMEPLPVGLLMRHPFDSLARAPQVKVPALMLVGEGDTLIPPAHSRRLAAAWGGPVELVAYPGFGHNDIHVNPHYDAAIRAFLDRYL